MSYQTIEYEPALTWLLKIIARSKDVGYPGNPDEIKVKFHPLSEPTPKEQEEIKKIRVEMLVALVKEGIITPEEAAESQDVAKLLYERALS